MECGYWRCGGGGVKVNFDCEMIMMIHCRFWEGEKWAGGENGVSGEIDDEVVECNREHHDVQEEISI